MLNGTRNMAVFFNKSTHLLSTCVIANGISNVLMRFFGSPCLNIDSACKSTQ